MATGWPSEVFSKRLGAAVQLAQLAAIFAAGAWAFFVWRQTAQAATETGLQVSGETAVAWSETHKACKGSFRINVENVGQRNVQLSSASYSLVAVPATRLAAGERLRVLSMVDTAERPVTGDLKGLAGRLVPKEKRFKEVWFIFNPDRSQQFSVEAVFDEGRADTLTRWHAEVESCDAPSRPVGH